MYKNVKGDVRKKAFNRIVQWYRSTVEHTIGHCKTFKGCRYFGGVLDRDSGNIFLTATVSMIMGIWAFRSHYTPLRVHVILPEGLPVNYCARFFKDRVQSAEDALEILRSEQRNLLQQVLNLPSSFSRSDENINTRRMRAALGVGPFDTLPETVVKDAKCEIYLPEDKVTIKCKVRSVFGNGNFVSVQSISLPKTYFSIVDRSYIRMVE